MEVRPMAAPGRQMIERYGPGGFHISGVTFTGPVLITSDVSIAWAVTDWDSVTPESLAPLVERGGIQILLMGTGGQARFLPKTLRVALRSAGIVTEAMDTAAACRTYNVLLAEERRVAAALLPVRA